jgi:hypothetical protein
MKIPNMKRWACVIGGIKWHENTKHENTKHEKI